MIDSRDSSYPESLVDSQSMPQFHVGLIGDGVRRWARLKGMDLRRAYLTAMTNVATFVDFFFRNDATIISLYMLSKENLGRPKEDLDAAIDAETIFFETALLDLVKKWSCSVVHAGRPELLPKKYVKAIDDLSGFSDGNGRKIYLLAAYNPFDEIRHAVQNHGLDFQNSLWVREPADIVIRTSGEYRISNFIPLQSGYAELFFLSKHINELDESDCRQVLEAFQQRRRRLGR